ncbi:MAG TPA: hypothetical protein VKY39_09595, partial [Aggregatilineales bacterium]|nr:hypothetical protein [Aggregatilineales bacterium]
CLLAQPTNIVGMFYKRVKRMLASRTISYLPRAARPRAAPVPGVLEPEGSGWSALEGATLL